MLNIIVATNILTLSSSNTVPFLFDKDSLYFDKFIIFDKSEYSTFIKNYNKASNITEYTTSANISYLNKPISTTKKLALSLFNNDSVIIR